MSEIQYLDYDGLQRYHELIDAKKADKSQISNVLRYSEQSLTAEQKAQVRTNIGAGTSSFSGSYNDLTNKPAIPSAANDGTFSVKTKVGNNNAVTVADFSANQSSTDDVTLIQGTNITLTTNTTNRTITIAATDTTYSDATTSASGLMSSADKTKLNGIAAGATANTGTITGITMNGASKGTSGVVNLGTVITAHQDISGKVNTSTTVNGHALTGNVTVTKSDVGLSNVTNDSQVKRSEMGAASGVATLDSSGKVPSSQLPSYVDDVIEAYYKVADGKFYTTLSSGTYSGAITGETGKIYVDLSTSRTYRWGGSAYAEIKASPGTLDDITDGSTYVRMTSAERTKLSGIATGATANVGTITGIKMNGSSKGTSGVVDLGTVITSHQNISGKADKSATVSTVTYDTTNKKLTKTINGTTTDIVTVSTIKTDLGLTKSDVELGNVGNFKAVSTVASQGLSNTEKSNARANIGAGTSSFSGSYADLTNKPSTITHGAVGSAILDSTKQIDALFIS